MQRNLREEFKMQFWQHFSHSRSLSFSAAQSPPQQPSSNPPRPDFPLPPFKETNNPYKCLGVSPQATIPEIQRAFRNLAKTYHPDKYRSSVYKQEAETAFKAISHAYQLLLRYRRKNHDEMFRHWEGRPGASRYPRRGASYASTKNGARDWWLFFRHPFGTGKSGGNRDFAHMMAVPVSFGLIVTVYSWYLSAQSPKYQGLKAGATSLVSKRELEETRSKQVSIYLPTDSKNQKEESD